MPRQSELSDTAQAERFVKARGDDFRRDHQRKQWFEFQGHRWQPDADGAATRAAIALARQFAKTASRIKDEKTRNRHLQFAAYCESARGISNVLKVAGNLPPIANPGGRWDPNQWLLGTPDGIVDLRTGLMREGQPEDMITKSTGVRYDPRARCPRWERFLEEIFPGEPELVAYVQRVLGYALTGITTEQVWWLLVGSGANGKSTLINVASGVLGDYAFTIPFTAVVMARYRSSIPDDIAHLVGKRFVSASEAIEAAQLDDARIKALTGQDRLSARHLYGRFFEFEPVLKLFLSCNQPPSIGDDSFGFWRRLHVLPFNERFEGRNRDNSLLDTLKAEGPGILRWMVEGCRKWQQEGLSPPEIVLEAVEVLKEESDPLNEFLKERCEDVPNGTCKAGVLYEAYHEWAQSQGISPHDRLNTTMFGRRMGERYKKVHTRKGQVYIGIRFRQGIVSPVPRELR